MKDETIKVLEQISNRDNNWKQSFYNVIRFLKFECICGSNCLHIKDDDSIICDNCKREFDIKIEEKQE